MSRKLKPGEIRIVDPGHIYDMKNLGKGSQRLRFVKRSGGAITHTREYAGVQTQAVLRALIERTKYLDQILPCDETKDALQHLRMALFLYEARAWRRKQQKLNRKKPQHDDSARARPWRNVPYDDVPFSEFEIEMLPTGDDGHIVIPRVSKVHTQKVAIA